MSNFQFPLLGFLLCILEKMATVEFVSVNTFNSLYWDFCFASATSRTLIPNSSATLSIPFIGIFALHRFSPDGGCCCGACLSIPFIGIFALHPSWQHIPPRKREMIFQFPLLGFLLCILGKKYVSHASQKYFQFPLLGFLLCITIAIIAC